MAEKLFDCYYCQTQYRITEKGLPEHVDSDWDEDHQAYSIDDLLNPTDLEDDFEYILDNDLEMEFEMIEESAWV